MRVAFLKNFLLREPAYRVALAAVLTPREEVGQPLMRFLRLEEPGAAARAGRRRAQLRRVGRVRARRRWRHVGRRRLAHRRGESGARHRGIRGHPHPGASGGARLPRPRAPPDRRGLSPDWRRRRRSQLRLPDRSGARRRRPDSACCRQDAHGRFADVTAATKLPASILRTPAYGVWPADVDTDGDLDLVLAPRDGPPRRPAQQRATGRSRRADVFPRRARACAASPGPTSTAKASPTRRSLDEAGAVHVFLNQRGGSFRAETLPRAPSQAVAIAPASDAATRSSICWCCRATDRSRGSRARPAPARGRRARSRAWIRPSDLAAGAARLLVADLDNNGAPDLIVASAAATRVVLGGPGGAWTPLAAPVALGVQAVADLDGDGRLELVGRLPDGRPGRASVKGSKPYHWQILRTRATTATGRSADQLVRHRRRDRDAIRAARAEAGDHVAPSSTSGWARRTSAEVVAHHLAERRPAVGVRREGRHHGEGHAAAQGIVPVAVRLERPRDGVRHRPALALAARPPHQRAGDGRRADDRGLGEGPRRPAGAARWRLRSAHHGGAVGDALLRSRLAAGRRSSRRHRGLRRRALRGAAAEAGGGDDRAGAADSRRCATTRGSDVSELGVGARLPATSTSPAAADTRASRAGTSSSSSCPESAPRSGPLWLVAQGWVHPTDSSINVAIAQGAHAAPEGLSLAGRRRRRAIPDRARGARLPVGQGQDDADRSRRSLPARGSRRLRLGTNLEIFWDRLGWAVGRPDVNVDAAPARAAPRPISRIEATR